MYFYIPVKNRPQLHLGDDTPFKQRLDNYSRDGKSTGIQCDVITHSNKMVARFLILRDEEERV